MLNIGNFYVFMGNFKIHKIAQDSRNRENNVNKNSKMVNCSKYV